MKVERSRTFVASKSVSYHCHSSRWRSWCSGEPPSSRATLRDEGLELHCGSADRLRVMREEVGSMNCGTEDSVWSEREFVDMVAKLGRK